jgi:hypothetical protein
MSLVCHGDAVACFSALKVNLVAQPPLLFPLPLPLLVGGEE